MHRRVSDPRHGFHGVEYQYEGHRRGLVTTVFGIQSLIDKHDTHLFRSITYTDHCLHYLLPEKLNRSRNLRHRGHEYLVTSEPPTLRIPLSIDVCLAWSSSLCFIVFMIQYTSHLLRIDI